MPLDLVGQQQTAATPDAPLALRGVTVTYGEKPAILSVDMTLEPGKMTAIVGPNGAGKSTLLKAALGVVSPLAGQVHFFGKALSEARHRIAYVPQRASVDWDFPTTAFDVVMMGLYPQLGLLGRVRGAHKARVTECLARVNMEEFANRQIGQLSGGQQQRVFLARALAQGADLYLLDEPFAGVDAATERAIFGVLKELVAEGKTVVAVHHDLSTVETYFDNVLLLATQKIAEGPVGTTFTQEALQSAYGGRLAENDALKASGLAG